MSTSNRKKDSRNKARNSRSARVVLSVFVLLFALWLIWQSDTLIAPTDSDFEPGTPVQPSASAAIQTPHGANPSAPDGVLEVYVLDVGQGDSIFLRSPSGRTMLVDTGESRYFEAIDAFLHQQGVETLDAVVATHPHSDHIGAMSKVIKAYEIGEFYLPEVTHTSATYERMIDALEEQDVPVTFVAVTAGEVDLLPWDDAVSVQAFSPLEETDYEDLNDWSVMLRVALGESAIVLTGDAETYAEDRVLDSLDPALLRATVLKMGHHGSSTSSGTAFMDAVAPEICVISCGEGNDYGHPHKETLQMLTQRVIRCLRTDINGTIKLTLKGSEVSVSTEK